LAGIFPFIFFSSIACCRAVALVILLVAGVTDILDGYVARKTKQVTKLGAQLDPVADKILAMVVFYSFWQADLIPGLALFLIVMREAIMIGGSCFFYYTKTAIMSANWAGKGSTLFYYLTFIFLLQSIPGFYILLYIAIGLAYLAMLWYLVSIWKTKNY
jgi:cardiolipin synthase